jgi:hypothetical protein
VDLVEVEVAAVVVVGMAKAEEEDMAAVRVEALRNAFPAEDLDT